MSNVYSTMKVCVDNDTDDEYDEFSLEDEVMITTNDGCCGNYRIIAIYATGMQVVSIEDENVDSISLKFSEITAMETV